MFFRRQKPKTVNFEDRLKGLKEAGFDVQSQSNGNARVSKLGCAAIISDNGNDSPKLASKAGVVVGKEIGYLVHGGYQTFFQTESGRKVPALAEHLKALHHFSEDLGEALGLTSLYNTSLGTIFDKHLYDRVEERDLDRPEKPWEAPVR